MARCNLFNFRTAFAFVRNLIQLTKYAHGPTPASPNKLFFQKIRKSIPYLKESDIGLCLQLHESSPRLHTLFVYIFFYISYHLSLRLLHAICIFFVSHLCYFSRPSEDTVNVYYCSLCSVLYPSVSLFFLRPKAAKFSNEL